MTETPPPSTPSPSPAPLRRDVKGAVVPPAEVRTYYDRAVIKRPVWKPEIPWYLFFGGLAGSSSGLALAARLVGNRPLARHARRASAVGAMVSPVLLILDLGVPARFPNMLRVFRPTSPMNVGSWLLTAFGPAAVSAALLDELGRLPRLQRLSEAVAGGLGLGMSTYTAVLISDTAVPVWHDAHRELPFVFAGSAAASAGAAALVVAPPDDAGPARRLTLAGAGLAQGATVLMQRRLGEIAEPYHQGASGRYAKLAKALTVVGAATVALVGRRRAGAAAGGGLVLAGAVLERWAVFKAGFPSAEDPRYTVEPQRARLEGRDGERVSLPEPVDAT